MVVVHCHCLEIQATLRSSNTGSSCGQVGKSSDAMRHATRACSGLHNRLRQTYALPVSRLPIAQVSSAEIAQELKPRIKAVVLVSAHWEVSTQICAVDQLAIFPA